MAVKTGRKGFVCCDFGKIEYGVIAHYDDFKRNFDNLGNALIRLVAFWWHR